MSRYYWLSLFGFVFFIALLGLFFGYLGNDLHGDTSCDEKVTLSSPHPFLCERKITINQARVDDISLIEGISRKRAEAIYQYFKDNPHKKLDDVIELDGIGPKMRERLGEHFF